MESALSVSTTTLALFTNTKPLNRRSPPTSLFAAHQNYKSIHLNTQHSLQCVSSSDASFRSGGGSGGSADGGGGGGGGEGGASEENLDAKAGDVSSSSSPDVIILAVGGMMCGGCASSVKRILESQKQVSSATVNLATETAIVWPVSEAKVASNWQKDLGEELAKHLTNCGFKSDVKGHLCASGSDFFKSKTTFET
ncbi:hypothetical protein ACFE04_006684 [Oxalis oulophora]